jgi:K+-sensing histidine kinase KdpD
LYLPLAAFVVYRYPKPSISAVHLQPGVSTAVEVSGDIPAIKLDPGLVHQVVINALLNAGEWVPSGLIELDPYNY